MKNLAVVVIFLVVLTVLVKYGMDRYLEEAERHNKFLEDRIDRDGLQYILKVDNPEEVSEEPPAEEIEAQAVAPQEPVATNGAVAPAAQNKPKYLDIAKVSDAVKIIYGDWKLKTNKDFKNDLENKSQKEFVNEYLKEILGEEIRLQFGLTNKAGALYTYYKSKGVTGALAMSERILIQLFKYGRTELKPTK